MAVVLSLIINIIFILFPNLVYLIYVVNKHNLKEKEDLILFDFSLLISLFLIVLYNKYFLVNNIILYFLLVLLFSFLNKRTIGSIFISIISFSYIQIFYQFNDFIILLLFIFLFILYFSIKKKNKTFSYIFYFTSLIISFFAFYLKGDFSYINFLGNSILYFLIIKLSKYWINKCKEILQLQNQLKEFKNQTKLSESLFKITHEIKNPLAVVKGYLSMININNKEKSIDYLSIINSEVERTINLLEDFMQFSKIKLNIEPFQMNLLLEESRKILTPLFKNKNIDCNFKTENNIIYNGDYNRIKQVIINIVKNSIEASLPNSRISLYCYTNNKAIIIVVKDNGCGMDDNTIENLYTPFYTTKERGTGLGICLSKQIIEAHKGKIIYSSILRKGTTVKMVLPINC